MLRWLAFLFLTLAAVCDASARTPAETGGAGHIFIDKSERLLILYDKEGGAEISRHRIALGFAPIGDKAREGDGRTPEGRYRINAKNPKSQFHLSLKISYPDRDDVADARSRGVSPGGDIFIHGTPGTSGMGALGPDRRDWTLGCIAVGNDEIEEIWRLVKVGASVEISP